MIVVVDSTIILAQILPEENALAIEDLVLRGDVELITAAHMVSETVSGIHQAIGRRRLSAYAATARLAAVRHLDIDVQRALAWPEMTAVLELAQSTGLSVPDTGYLQLAIARGATLATLDHRLRTAANAAGVALWPPN